MVPNSSLAKRQAPQEKLAMLEKEVETLQQTLKNSKRAIKSSEAIQT